MNKAASISDILQLGDPRLYEVCEPVKYEELDLVPAWVERLSSAMNDVRANYGFGRGIAAPQLGIMKRLFYIQIDSPEVIINPSIENTSTEMFEIWDDCMSFPNLLVKVRRHISITLHYRNQAWEKKIWEASGAISELLQHENDHLDGILCTMRAIDNQSFRWRDSMKINH